MFEPAPGQPGKRGLSCSRIEEGARSPLVGSSATALEPFGDKRWGKENMNLLWHLPSPSAWRLEEVTDESGLSTPARSGSAAPWYKTETSPHPAVGEKPGAPRIKVDVLSTRERGITPNASAKEGDTGGSEGPPGLLLI